MKKDSMNQWNRSAWRYLVTLSVCLCMAACSPSSDYAASNDNDTDNPHSPQAKWVPLNLTCAVTGGLVTTRTDVPTKPLTGASDRIGLFLKGQEGMSDYAAISNQLYTYGTPFWKTEEELLLNDAEAVLGAYYPYREDATNLFAMQTQPYVADKELYYVSDVKASKATRLLTLNLRRPYALIRFVFFKGVAEEGKGGYTDPGLISKFAFTTTLRTQGQLSLPDGTVTGEMLNATVQTDFGGTPITALLKAETDLLTPPCADFLVVPCAAKEKFTFVATVDGLEMPGSFAASSLYGTAGAIEEGVKYEVWLTIRSIGIRVNRVIQTVDWPLPTPVDGDYVVQ